jgi:hypothetical protein
VTLWDEIWLIRLTPGDKSIDNMAVNDYNNEENINFERVLCL